MESINYANNQESEQSSTELQQRLRKVLNSDRAALSPTELRELQIRIAKALSDLMVLEDEGIEFTIEREQGRRVLHLNLPVRHFIRDTGKEL